MLLQVRKIRLLIPGTRNAFHSVLLEQLWPLSSKPASRRQAFTRLDGEMRKKKKKLKVTDFKENKLSSSSLLEIVEKRKIKVNNSITIYIKHRQIFAP